MKGHKVFRENNKMKKAKYFLICIIVSLILFFFNPATAQISQCWRRRLYIPLLRLHSGDSLHHIGWREIIMAISGGTLQRCLGFAQRKYFIQYRQRRQRSYAGQESCFFVRIEKRDLCMPAASEREYVYRRMQCRAFAGSSVRTAQSQKK